MNPTCTHCQQPFTIEAQDLAFYEKVSPVFNGKKYLVPPPQMCPDCRQQHRQLFRNERKIYQNKCDSCETPFLSMYSPNTTNQVIYCAKCWWSDNWDPLDYGQAFDFSRPFFEQWQEIWEKSPKLGVLSWGDNVNCDFTNDIVKSKNCYLVFDGEQGEDSYYGETFNVIKNSLDFLFLKDSELCYECINCINCYTLQYSRFSQNCSNSYFLLDCQGCKNCFGCVNLQQKEYYIFNKPHTKKQYEAYIGELNLSNYTQREAVKTKVEDFFMKHARRAYRGRMSENSRGNNINNCTNALDCFDCNQARDVRYCTNMMVAATDCYDVDSWGENTNLVYNSAMSGLGASQIIGSHYTCFNVSNAYHSAFCWHNCNNIFGCINLRHKEYCILNKQYSKEEYESLVPKIIEHMQQTGEWAQFFPPQLSAFGYNETVANEFFPLTKEQAVSQGFKWNDYEAPKPQVKSVVTSTDLAEDIRDIQDDIHHTAISCEVTGRLFRIVKAELDYYRAHNIPLPRRHPDQRHTDRMNLRPPRKLWSRKCNKCEVEITTPYSPERPETVVCEECYLQIIS